MPLLMNFLLTSAITCLATFFPGLGAIQENLPPLDQQVEQSPAPEARRSRTTCTLVFFHPSTSEESEDPATSSFEPQQCRNAAESADLAEALEAANDEVSDEQPRDEQSWEEEGWEDEGELVELSATWAFPEQPIGLTASVPDTIRRYEAEILAAAQEHGVDPATIAAIVYAESKGNPRAVSHAGAMGLMQVMPSWFARGEDPFHPATNISRGTAIFRQALDEFNDEQMALAAYLSGSNAVRRYGAVPSYAWPYVRAVLAERERYRADA